MGILRDVTTGEYYVSYETLADITGLGAGKVLLESKGQKILSEEEALVIIKSLNETVFDDIAKAGYRNHLIQMTITNR